MDSTVASGTFDMERKVEENEMGAAITAADAEEVPGTNEIATSGQVSAGNAGGAGKEIHA